MTINRNNYEEFFLLYVDNELSAQEKNTVDAFLTENPDLQEEMLMLQQSILIPDEAVFTDKESLLKPETVDSKMQEQLLLMLDNELDKKTKGNLLKSIEKDPAAKQEWEILQQTKLSAADRIIFEDKAILYKEEGGRVIAIRWWKIAAAALLIGFGVWGVLNYSNKAMDIWPVNTAKTTPVKSSTPKETVPQNINEQPAVTNKVESNDASTAVNTTKADNEIKTPVVNKVKNSIVNNKEQQEVLPVKDIAQQKQIIQPPSNNLPKPLENINNNDRNNNDVAIVPPSNSIKSEPDVLQPKETIPDNSVVMVKFSEDENGSEDENDGKNRKSKIGGFFKKLKRVVERKTNVKTGDDKSFKIANMSFAMQ